MRLLTIPLAGLLIALALLAAPSGVLAQPNLSVIPPAGPIGTRFDVLGSGLPPGPVTIVFRLPTGVEDRGGPPATVGAAGTLQAAPSWVSEPGEPLGVYTVTVEAMDGTVLATATFTVTGAAGTGTAVASPATATRTTAVAATSTRASSPAAVPTGTGGTVPTAPPATGAGGLAQRQTTTWLLLTGLIGLGLAGLACCVAVRRRSAADSRGD